MAKNITKQEVINLIEAREGNVGVRIINHTTVLDSMGTEENADNMSDAEVIASAWEETKRNFLKKIKKAETAHKAEQLALEEERDQIFVRGEERLSRTENREEQVQIMREIRDEVNEFDVLNAGVLKDFKADVGEPLHPNWITFTPGEQQAEDTEEGFILPEDDRSKEFVPEREDSVTPKLDKKNFEHLDWLKSKRDAKFEQLKGDIINAARVSWKQKNTNELDKWERQVHRVRDVSFEQKLLNMVTKPENRNRNYWIKQAPKYIKELYESSRMLNFEQHQQLIDMIRVYRIAVVKRTKPNLKMLEALWNLRQKASKVMKDKEISQADKNVRVTNLNKKISDLREYIEKSDELAALAIKNANEEPIIVLNVERIEKQRLIMIRDQMRVKWEYYRDMVIDLRSNTVVDIDIFEQEDLLNWANAKLVQIEAEAKAFVAKHGLKTTDTIENA